MEDRRRDRIASIPNALGALSVALMVFVLSTLMVLNTKVTRLEAETKSIADWRATYQQSPWNTGHNVREWLGAQEVRLKHLEDTVKDLDQRLDVIEFASRSAQ